MVRINLGSFQWRSVEQRAQGPLAHPLQCCPREILRKESNIHSPEPAIVLAALAVQEGLRASWQIPAESHDGTGRLQSASSNHETPDLGHKVRVIVRNRELVILGQYG